jgi:hypothetical protein
MQNRSDMTPMTPSSCSCPDAPIVPKSPGRRVAAIAVAIALVAVIAWGETWAIEHVPVLIDQCSPALATDLGRVFGEDCGYSAAPFAVVH